MTPTASSRPVLRPATVCSSAGTWPRTLSETPRGGAPTRASAASRSREAAPSDRQALEIFRRGQAVLRDLHLDLKGVPARRVAPVVRFDEPAGRGGGDQ